jgi:hypothetical protein
VLTPSPYGVFVTTNQNISSNDFNALNQIGLSLMKALNVDVLAQNSTLISGMTVNWPIAAEPVTYMTVSAGAAFVNLAADPSLYSGALFINSTTQPLTITTADPTNPRIDGIDLIYAETTGTNASRDFINPTTGVISSIVTPTRAIPTYTIHITPGTPAGSPVAPAVTPGGVRLATFQVAPSTGNVSNITYLLPFMWENQTFPGTPNTPNQSLTLADSLASIRAQLNSIIGAGNWYSAVPNSLAQLLIDLDSSIKGENLFINGSMLVAQAGAGGTITASTPAYTLDGFIVNSVGANCAWSQTLVNNQNVLKLVPAGTLTDLYVKQRIESTQMQSIGYQNITIQAQITNNTGGTITPTLALNVPTATNNYASVTAALSATNLQPIANGVTSIVAYTFAVTSAYAYQNGMEVIFDFAASVGSGTNVEITNTDCSATPYTGVGLNANPPLFKSKNISLEISSCSRYCFKNSATGGLPGGCNLVGTVTNTGVALFFLPFSGPLFVGPLGKSFTSIGSFLLGALSGPPYSATVSSLSSINIGQNGMLLEATFTDSSITTGLPVSLGPDGPGTTSLIVLAQL